MIPAGFSVNRFFVAAAATGAAAAGAGRDETCGEARASDVVGGKDIPIWVSPGVKI